MKIVAVTITGTDKAAELSVNENGIGAQHLAQL